MTDDDTPDVTDELKRIFENSENIINRGQPKHQHSQEFEDALKRAVTKIVDTARAELPEESSAEEAVDFYHSVVVSTIVSITVHCLHYIKDPTPKTVDDFLKESALLYGIGMSRGCGAALKHILKDDDDEQ